MKSATRAGLIGVSVLGALTLLSASFGIGAATADDYEGMTYADASAEASAAGMTPTVGTIVGASVATGDCIVTSSQSVSLLRPAAIDESYPQYYNASDLAAAGIPGVGDLALHLDCTHAAQPDEAL